MALLLGVTQNKQLTRKIQVMQNNVIRIMNFKFLKDCVKVNSLYKSINILQFSDVYELELAKFMHAYYKETLAENFNSYFSTAAAHHSHNTRSVVNKTSICKE